jgi:DNA polymerase III epsilon subunit-like protein
MINYNKICVFDFETDGSDPLSCSPVQIAAVMVDPLQLSIIPDSEFNINFKPEVLENNPNYIYEGDILDFHAKVKGSSKEQVLAEWKEYPSQKQSWNLFIEYLSKYHCRSGSKKSQFTAPIAAGYNIHRFDLIIVDRLSKKYNNLNKENRSNIFYMRDVLDIMNIVFLWFENNQDLSSYSLDSLREYLGISKDGAHDAIKDVKDSAEILIRFMKLHRKLSRKILFKDSFGKTTV